MSICPNCDKEGEHIHKYIYQGKSGAFYTCGFIPYGSDFARLMGVTGPTEAPDNPTSVKESLMGAALLEISSCLKGHHHRMERMDEQVELNKNNIKSFQKGEAEKQGRAESIGPGCCPGCGWAGRRSGGIGGGGVYICEIAGCRVVSFERGNNE